MALVAKAIFYLKLIAWGYAVRELGSELLLRREDSF